MNCEITNFILLLYLCCNVATSVKVKVEQGWLEGQVLVPSTGRGKYYSFKGIPYAKPPLKNLRFRAPRPPLKWKGIRNASEHGSVCVQYETLTSSNIIGSENCLFLNVYSPNLNPTTPLQVMFFIHGGAFITGSGNDDRYSPDFLMAFGIVLVTINYRLDVLGFFTADTEEVPGNAGLKDQISALQWVQRNIRNFGGDPQRVTIFGQSAGGSSVTYHVVSPAATGLFQRGIAMSGTLYNDWSVEFEPRRRGFVLGRKLGLDTDNPYELTEFLRTIPAKKLLEINPDILISDRISNILLNRIYFTPVVEKKFGNGEGQYLTVAPTTLLCRGQINQVDYMTGHAASEGLRSTALDEDNILKYYPDYKELLVPLRITNIRSPKEVLRLADRIQRFYFGNQTISEKTITDFVRFDSYFTYVYDIHAFIEKLPKVTENKRYFYGFDIYSTRNVYSRLGAMKFGIEKATHRDDLPYLFDGSSYNMTVDVNSEAFKYVQLMCTLYTNFAKYGTPTPDDSLGLIWPDYNPNRSAVIIGVNGNLSSTTISYNITTDIGFWHNIYESTGINF